MEKQQFMSWVKLQIQRENALDPIWQEPTPSKSMNLMMFWFLDQKLCSTYPYPNLLFSKVTLMLSDYLTESWLASAWCLNVDMAFSLAWPSRFLPETLGNVTLIFTWEFTHDRNQTHTQIQLFWLQILLPVPSGSLTQVVWVPIGCPPNRVLCPLAIQLRMFQPSWHCLYLQLCSSDCTKHFFFLFKVTMVN